MLAVYDKPWQSDHSDHKIDISKRKIDHYSYKDSCERSGLDLDAFETLMDWLFKKTHGVEGDDFEN